MSFYDSNRTGVLVSRIMNDVEGIRNLMGSGLVELLGALLTASIASFFLMHRNAQMTLIVFTVLAVFILIAQAAFKKLRPLFRERSNHRHGLFSTQPPSDPAAETEVVLAPLHTTR